MRPNWSFVLELLEKFTAHTKTVACRQSLIAKIFLFLRVLDLCCIHLLISQKSYPARHFLPVFKSLHHHCGNFSPDGTIGGPIRIKATGLRSDSPFIPDQNLKSLVLDSIKLSWYNTIISPTYNLLILRRIQVPCKKGSCATTRTHYAMKLSLPDISCGPPCLDIQTTFLLVKTYS